MQLWYNSNMNRKFFSKKDLWIILGIAVLAVGGLLYYLLQPRGNTAVITYNGAVIAEIDLSRDKTYHFDADLPVTLEVTDGHIRFIDAQCPDKICMGFGLIGSEGEYAICAPAKLSVVIELQPGS